MKTLGRSFTFLVLLMQCFHATQAFVPSNPRFSSPSRYGHDLNSVSSKTSMDISLTDLMNDAEDLIIQSKGSVPIETLEPLLASIETQSTYKEPNREPNFKGTWHVWYTNCPPPSNGQLGPFQGSAEQVIAPTGDSYKNVLRLPPHCQDNEWLTVVLDGIWEDWDGNELQDGNAPVSVSASSAGAQPTTEDYGAKFWKVTFLRLNFNLFGNRILSKDFPAGVARVWRTTYLDEDTKIVRAGRTGRVDDESVFYMKTSQRPSVSR